MADQVKATDEPAVPNKGQMGPDWSGSACPTSREYNDIISVFRNYSLDPKKLGDLDALDNKYNCEIHSPADAVTYGKEALHTLHDKYAAVMSNIEVDAFLTSLRGDIQGVGVQMRRDTDPATGKGVDNGPVHISRVFPDTPAAAAGLQKGDLIVKVNGDPVAQKSLDQVTNAIRGPVGDPVTLTISRGGEEFDRTITRSQMHIPAVSDAQLLPGNVAYIQLQSFEANSSAEEVKAALEKFRDSRGVILDLRDNPGGQRDLAILVTSLFMEKGVVMTVDDRIPSPITDPRFQRTTMSLTTDNIVSQAGAGTPQQTIRYPDLVNRPTVILVNGGSASASEIVAGALQDSQDAHLIGTRTGGKGVGQSFFDGPDGSLIKLTSSRSLLPKGRWVGDGDQNIIGIEPDEVVQNPANAQPLSPDDVQLQAALKWIAAQPDAKPPSWLPRFNFWPFSRNG